MRLEVYNNLFYKKYHTGFSIVGENEGRISVHFLHLDFVFLVILLMFSHLCFVFVFTLINAL